jgi:phosphoglycerol transferase MdoB-like AlkP superfamily enzyme
VKVLKKILLLLIALVALMSLKWHFYYEMIQMSEGSLLTVILTVMMSLWIFFALEKAGKHKGAWIFVVIYSVVSVIFLVDVVYFKQFNARATVKILQNVGVVGDIGDSILGHFITKAFYSFDRYTALGSFNSITPQTRGTLFNSLAVARDIACGHGCSVFGAAA